ncbi:hypothetical protein GCM10007416_00630 [Kroppenstedtia guangzhouensis]|uniref:Phage portal protein n=1 Tax=Kroppenstedtia guangzhouensis TaxID=1274356 RepID=A0ABQ1FWX2_9BACL|nr:phage portal protein [Kroppenstedtia guangzhouensis]GGA31961.1 hypothetical protein GCM10007416_00630 [Kroppenstedtia guangzhouensis]
MATIKDKPTTRAFVLKNGDVVPASTLDRFAVKSLAEQAAGSRQIEDDLFANQYNEMQVIQPQYDPGTLIDVMDQNTYHYRCVQAKARDVTGLGWKLVPAFKKDEEDREPDETQKATVLEFLRQPHPEETLEEILFKFWTDYEAVGWAALEIIRNNQANPQQITGLRWIPAHTIRIHRDRDRYVQIRGARRVWFKALGAPFDVDWRTGLKFFPPNVLRPTGVEGVEDEEDPSITEEPIAPEHQGTEVLYLTNHVPSSDYYGTPDVMPALAAILGDIARAEYNIEFFENFGVPAYAVTVIGTELDDDTVAAIKKYFQKDLKEKRHGTLVLTAQKDPALGEEAQDIKIEFQALAVDVKEASFRLYRKDNRDEVLSAHGVPPYRAGIAEEGSLGGSTAAESTEIYKQSIILPRQQILEVRITRHILREAYGVTDWKFEFERIDTRDEERDIEILESKFNLGALTINDIRRELGQEAIDHPLMDMPFINGTPLDEIAKTLGLPPLFAASMGVPATPGGVVDPIGLLTGEPTGQDPAQVDPVALLKSLRVAFNEGVRK